MKYKAKVSNNATKELGKISNINFGIGGYQDCQFGLSVDLNIGGGNSYVGDYISGG